MSATIASSKQLLRKTILSKLASLKESDVQRQTSVVLANLFSLPEFRKAESLSVFLSMPGGEIATDHIVKEAFRLNKKVFVPYTYRNYDTSNGKPRNIMEMLSLDSESDYLSLPVDKMNIRKPHKDTLGQRKSAIADACRLDLIVMPGVAFDSKLNRLGHGQGCYDYFLARYNASLAGVEGQASLEKAFLGIVGLALEEQLVSQDKVIPTDLTDWPLSCLLVGDGQVILPEKDQ